MALLAAEDKDEEDDLAAVGMAGGLGHEYGGIRFNGPSCCRSSPRTYGRASDVAKEGLCTEH
jgi:hypothetical protein